MTMPEKILKVSWTATRPLHGWRQCAIDYSDPKLERSVLWIPASVEPELLEDLLIDTYVTTKQYMP